MTDEHSDRELLGPIEIEAKIRVVHPDGHTGTVTYAFPPGQPVTAEGLERAARSALKAVSAQGFALMGADTFFNHVLVLDKTGQVGSFALPPAFNYGDPWGLATCELPRREVDEDDGLEDC